MSKATYATRIDALPDLLKVIDTCKLFVRNKDVEEMRQTGVADVRIVGLLGGSRNALVFTGCLQPSDSLDSEGFIPLREVRLKFQQLATCDSAISSVLAKEQQTEKGELWALLAEEEVVEQLETFPDETVEGLKDKLQIDDKVTKSAGDDVEKEIEDGSKETAKRHRENDSVEGDQLRERERPREREKPRERERGREKESKRERIPFDVTSMTYEEYCQKHYSLAIERFWQSKLPPGGPLANMPPPHMNMTPNFTPPLPAMMGYPQGGYVPPPPVSAPPAPVFQSN